ncbi:MAG: ABC transporter ATP-binding protein [Bacillota bacterium]
MRGFGRIFSLLKPHWPLAVAVFLAMLSNTALEIVPSYLTQQVVDRGIGRRDYRLVAVIAILLVVAALLKGIVNFTQWTLSELVGQNVTYDLRKRLHDHLQTLSHGYFAQTQTGQVMSRLTGDVDCVQRFVGWGAILLGNVVLMFLGVSAFLFWLNWRLTLVSMVAFPFLARVVFWYQKLIRPAWEKVRERMGRLTTVLQENVTGVRVVKAFAREDYEMGKFAGKNREFLEENLARAAIEAEAQPLMDFLSGLSVVVLIWYGGYLVASKQMTIGSLFAFQGLLWSLIWPIRMLGWLVNEAMRAQAAAPRLSEILDTKPEITDREGALDLAGVRGHLRFEDVSFSFKDSPEPVLRRVNLDIAPGEVVAVIGGTGSGKSTFVNLIPRFYDPTEGRILLDGHDLRDVTLASLRRQIGLVLQETFLFSATIRENIAYGKPDATDEEVAAAAGVAQATGFIDSFTKGYETRVGERGVGLSGGQKQRLALARALLVDPRVLVLDEATSSVDTETEYLIQEGLEEIMRGRTTIIIAKRLSTVKSATKIVVLEGGEVAQVGSHEELLAQEGPYHRLFEAQFGKGVASGVAPVEGGED